MDTLKAAQIRYRRNPQNPDGLEEHLKQELLDFCVVDTTTNDARIIPYHHPTNTKFNTTTTPHNNNNNNNNNTNTLNPISRYEGPMYTINKCPGFIIAPQALSKRLQLELATRALVNYCEYPHATNMDSFSNDTTIDTNDAATPSLCSCTNSMFHQWTLEQQILQQQQRRQEEEEDNSRKNKLKLKSKSKKNSRQPSIKHRKCIQNMSWSAMGYHYNWTARSYSEAHKSPLPLELQTLSAYFANCYTNIHKNKYTASACITNYYTPKSIMGAHKDDLEYALDKPVISYSIGLSAIFLLGGLTRDEKEDVYPILLRSGDVIMMGGESRLRYHGVARIFSAWVTASLVPTVDHKVLYEKCEVKSIRSFMGEENNSTTSASNDNEDDYSNEMVEEYVSKHRININVRQVLPDDVLQIPVTHENDTSDRNCELIRSVPIF